MINHKFYGNVVLTGQFITEFQQQYTLAALAEFVQFMIREGYYGVNNVNDLLEVLARQEFVSSGDDRYIRDKVNQFKAYYDGSEWSGGTPEDANLTNNHDWFILSAYVICG